MRKKRNKSGKDTKPVKGIKHHGKLSFLGFIIIIVVVLLLISHPGEFAFGFLSLLGTIASVSFGAIVVVGIIGGIVLLFITFFF